MKAKFVLLMLLLPILSTISASAQSPFPPQSQEEDSRQPSANNTTLYIWADGMNQYWSHFNSSDDDGMGDDGAGEIREQKDQGVITIKHRYTMDPTLDKRLIMTTGGEMRGNFNVYYEGDADSTDNSGPCQPGQTPNDCEWLNITIYKGQSKIYQHTESPWPAGNWKNIQFSWFVEEGNETWDGLNDNPLVEITMKVKGDYQEDIFFASGEPAEFAIELGEGGSLLMPIKQSSELSINEIGPFRNSVESYISPNGTEYPVVFLKESFHIDATLSQIGGQGLENKCLNIYIDPDENPIPISTIQTNANGMIEWFSGDSLQNPSLNGIDTTDGKLEGLRTLRVSYEPEQNVTGGCDEDLDSQTIGSHSEVEILVQSRVDIQVVKSWSYFGENAQYEDSQITGEVILRRDRIDLAIENEEVIFSRQYISPNNADWIADDQNISITDEQGKARFNWTFDGKTCSNQPCSGVWRVIAYYPGSFLFAPLQYNISFEIHTKDSVDSDGDGVSDHLDEFPNDANETHDDDGDGVGNNTDAFPQDANETHDDDGDGVGNNTDAFPQDANETMDTDGDGVGDNEDVEPDNPDVRYSDDIKVEISDTSSYIIAGAIVFLALVILFVRRKQPPMNDTHSQFAYEESLFKDN